VGDRILDRGSSACLGAAGVMVAAAERDGVAISDWTSSGCLLTTGVVLAPEVRNEDAMPSHASSSCPVDGVVIAAFAFSDVWTSMEALVLLTTYGRLPCANADLFVLELQQRTLVVPVC